MRFRPAILTPLCISFLFTPLYLLPAEAASAAQKVVVSFAGLNERLGALFVAKEQGIFQRHGLDVQLVHMRSGPVGIAALTTGDSQLHFGSATGASLGAMAAGLDLVFIAGLIKKLDGYFVVVPQIKSPSDLKGKNIGVVSIGGAVWMFTMLAFEHWGLNPERDNINFRVLPNDSVVAQAITTGTIDGANVAYTYGTNLERQGYRVLADLAKLDISFQGTGVLARRSFVQRSPEIAERALRAIVETIAFIQNPAHKAAVMQSLARWLRLPKVGDAEGGYEMMKGTYDRRIYPNVDGLRNVIRLLGKTNESIRRLRAEDIVDDRIVGKLEREGLF